LPFVPLGKPLSRPVPPASEYNSYITAGDNFPDRGGFDPARLHHGGLEVSGFSDLAAIGFGYHWATRLEAVQTDLQQAVDKPGRKHQSRLEEESANQRPVGCVRGIQAIGPSHNMLVVCRDQTNDDAW
ncbi:MAG: hypothetical protein KGS44_11850, partial [Alphaproteobacteria bacterium]|nr:hypothetical protein [Alphaproteobacteria bacterium]